jgi:Flp pilus assembly pilin Flp
VSISAATFPDLVRFFNELISTRRNVTEVEMSVLIKLLAITLWAACHALHCSLEWAHKLQFVEELLKGVSPAMLSGGTLAVALVSATTLTVVDFAQARGLRAFSFTMVHGLNLTLAWSIFSPTFSQWVVWCIEHAHALTMEFGAVAVLITASAVTLIEYMHGIVHIIQGLWDKKGSFTQ